MPTRLFRLLEADLGGVARRGQSWRDGGDTGPGSAQCKASHVPRARHPLEGQPP
ncbi:hypothetical protein D9M70_320750 [compost metagenome]